MQRDGGAPKPKAGRRTCTTSVARLVEHTHGKSTSSSLPFLLLFFRRGRTCWTVIWWWCPPPVPGRTHRPAAGQGTRTYVRAVPRACTLSSCDAQCGAFCSLLAAALVTGLWPGLRDAIMQQRQRWLAAEVPGEDTSTALTTQPALLTKQQGEGERRSRRL